MSGATNDPSTVAHRLTPSGRLHRKIGIVMPSMVAASSRLLSHSRIREAYSEYLITVHGVIRASVPLMQNAIDRARVMAPTDPVAAGIATYLERHVEEERGHDDWVLEDLEVLGIDRSLVWSRVPSPAVARLVGSQYYWSLHFHPVALLGYLAVFECYPPTPQLIEQLRARAYLPSEAFRTLAEHAELDPHHGDELNGVIDSLPMSREQEEVVGISAMSTVDLVARCIEEVGDAVEGGPNELRVTEGT